MSEFENNQGHIEDIELSQEMKKSFIDYSMSVIVDRALPDVRDGLKPVHKRILFGMHEANMHPDKAYKKCARIVGDVMGKYHPHGDSSIYDALVRLAQPFSIRYPLVDGQGNFGSIDGDGAAAQRYTECRMEKLAVEMVRDIEKNTVDFRPNYDGNEKEPVVLPSRYPNLLVNGAMGIAVGMATNIPSHNLGETIDGVIAMMDRPDISVLELLHYIKGPDFATGGIIHGTSGIREAYETGRGRLVVRARAEIVEEKNGRSRIEITELPYQVNKAKLVMSIAEMVKEKRIVGISNIVDLSDRNGLLISVEIKRDANAHIVLNQLYKHTKLQDTFGVNMLALVDMRPKQLNLKQMLYHYLEFQKEVVTRRTQFDLKKAQERAHILEGLLIALDRIDEVIRIIRQASSSEVAKTELMERFGLSELQAVAILDMRLRRLSQLEGGRIQQEYDELAALMASLTHILSDPAALLNVIRTELLEIKEKYGDPRRTAIEMQENEIDYEDLINEEDVVITLTSSGYIKRISADAYSAQRRGGKGIQAMNMKEDDLINNVFITSTHRNLLFFTNRGKVYRLKAYEIPDAGRNTKGMNIINLLPIEQDEKIQCVLSIGSIKDGNFLIMGTKLGVIKKTPLKDFTNLRKNGLIAIRLREDDELLQVKATKGTADMIFVTRDGMAIRFNEKNVRPMGRSSSGVRAIRLRKGDEAVTMDIAVEGEKLLLVSEHGLGKRTPIEMFRMQTRGGLGTKAYKVTARSGKVAAARVTNDEDEIMLVNSDGVAIRIKASDVSVASRNATGVILMKSKGDTTVVSMAKIKQTGDEEDLPDVEEIDSEDLLDRDDKHFDNEEVTDMDEFADQEMDFEELQADDEEAEDEDSITDELFDELNEAPEGEDEEEEE